MHRLIFAALLLPLALCAESRSVASSEVVARYRDLLLSGYTPGAQIAAPAPVAARPLAASLTEDGRWPDIDYANPAGAAWPAVEHLRRTRRLALAAANNADSPKDADMLRAAALKTLKHWTDHRYQNPNWWQNQIGVPQFIRDIIVLLGDGLAGEPREAALAVLRQLVVQPAGVGANTVWSAELSLMNAALSGDTDAMARASQLVAGEITVGGPQGIQRDFSFLQHGARLQQFHYGAHFLNDTVRIAWLLRGTPWALPDDKADLLVDFALQGNLWMSRGLFTVPCTLDRAVSRPGAMRWSDMRRPLAMLADLRPARRAELEAAIRIQEGKETPPAGVRVFPRADFAAAHRAAFSFFLKTVSSRTETTESFQRENLRGTKLNWGDHYLPTPESHYAGLPPVWDWDLLPGVTSSVAINAIQRQPFVGAISDGKSGAVVMDYRVGQAETTTLTARKFWAIHGDTVVALIGGLTAATSGEPIRTALDQRGLRGVVTVHDGRAASVLAEGNHDARPIRWIHHDGLLYVPLSSESVSVRTGPVTGTWKTINGNHSGEPVTIPVFLPVLEHGPLPAGVATGFAIMACASAVEAATLADRPGWRVLVNDTRVQAVRFADGTLFAAFHDAGEFVSEGVTIRAAQPAIVMMNASELRAADPLGRGGQFQFSINDRSVEATCPPDGGTSAPVRLQTTSSP